MKSNTCAIYNSTGYKNIFSFWVTKLEDIWGSWRNQADHRKGLSQDDCVDERRAFFLYSTVFIWLMFSCLQHWHILILMKHLCQHVNFMLVTGESQVALFSNIVSTIPVNVVMLVPGKVHVSYWKHSKEVKVCICEAASDFMFCQCC